ncbi:hypothetical protein AB0F44_02190 [Nocardioides sp. NPDC023903]|uniref:hypothetical protein n=1 Tax=Nocardioides sp. NPDC023903 TaxID=3157195 RepID=UPI0033C68099
MVPTDVVRTRAREAVADFAVKALALRPRPRATGNRSVIAFDDFRQTVRRYRPSNLLPALAELALVGAQEPEKRTELMVAIPPWAIATAARESVLWGNEYRRDDVDGEALRRIMSAHARIAEIDTEKGDDQLIDVLTRVAYEQFPYQASAAAEVSRSQALLVDGLGEAGARTFTLQTADRLLGAPLGQMVGATFMLHALASGRGGWIDLSAFDDPSFDVIFRTWPREVLDLRAEQLSVTFDEFKQRYEAAPKAPPGNARFDYNPLVDVPLLRMGDGRLLAPQPSLIMRTVTPEVLFYRGVEEFGSQPFGTDMGLLTQHYVGKQLRLLEPSVTLFPEVEYWVGKSRKDSTDWFLVFESLVVMIEVKSARYGWFAQAAGDGYKDRAHSPLVKGVDQLITTAGLLAEGRPEFAHIPTDRPLVGILVTAEPFYMANTPWVRDEVLSRGDIPITVASLSDIERMVCLSTDDVERRLLKMINDPERMMHPLDVGMDLVGEVLRNPILEAAWDGYPWPGDRQ